MSVLASCQGTGGRVCYSSVAVICLREVQSKLVQTAQPGSASWVNMQLRRGLRTTDSRWPAVQSVLCWNADPFHNLKGQSCAFFFFFLFFAALKTVVNFAMIAPSSFAAFQLYMHAVSVITSPDICFIWQHYVFIMHLACPGCLLGVDCSLGLFQSNTVNPEIAWETSSYCLIAFPTRT